MKKLYAFPIFCLLCFSAFSQKRPNQCIYPEDSTFELPADFKKYQKGEKTIVKLQTVVHVLHHDSLPDLNDEIVGEAIQKVTEDFRRLNQDTVNTPDAFKPVAADTEIEFELATIDPSGGPTNGITYTQIPEPFNQPVYYDSTGGHDAWDPSKYVNIWLVKSFLPTGTSTSPLSHGKPWDGVVTSYFVPLTDRFSRNITHRLGHYLGLKHPFGYEYTPSPSPTDTCSNTPGGPDELEDTPNQLYSSPPIFTCPDFPLTDICSPDAPGVMFMNYMDYSLSDCVNMFTRQQADVMNWVLDSIRFSLFEPVNSVDENDPYKNMEVHIYPNPFREKLIIETQSSSFSKKEYGIFDSMGRPVFTGVLDILPNSKNEINTALMPNGVYFLKIRSGHKIITQRIMKLK
jgi:hypothetical protein